MTLFNAGTQKKFIYSLHTGVIELYYILKCGDVQYCTVLSFRIMEKMKNSLYLTFKRDKE